MSITTPNDVVRFANKEEERMVDDNIMASMASSKAQYQALVEHEKDDGLYYFREDGKPIILSWADVINKHRQFLKDNSKYEDHTIKTIKEFYAQKLVKTESYAPRKIMGYSDDKNIEKIYYKINGFKVKEGLEEKKVKEFYTLPGAYTLKEMANTAMQDMAQQQGEKDMEEYSPEGSVKIQDVMFDKTVESIDNKFEEAESMDEAIKVFEAEGIALTFSQAPTAKITKRLGDFMKKKEDCTLMRSTQGNSVLYVIVPQNSDERDYWVRLTV